MSKARLIADISDDIVCGTAHGKYDAAYFLDGLMDEQSVTALDVSILLLSHQDSEEHMYVSERVRELVEAEAIKFFSDEPAGQDYVSDLMAEIERDRALEAA